MVLDLPTTAPGERCGFGAPPAPMGAAGHTAHRPPPTQGLGVLMGSSVHLGGCGGCLSMGMMMLSTHPPKRRGSGTPGCPWGVGGTESCQIRVIGARPCVTLRADPAPRRGQGSWGGIRWPVPTPSPDPAPGPASVPIPAPRWWGEGETEAPLKQLVVAAAVCPPGCRRDGDRD